jgi:hypothetical protein
MGGNGSNNVVCSSAGAAESEIGPATFFAATLGRHRERNGRNGSNNIFYSSAGGRGRNRSGNISYSSGRHGQVGVMGRREPEIGPATFFALQLPVSATEGRKSEIGPTPGPGGHCPTGTVTAHLNSEAKEWGAPRFQMRPRRLVAAEREYGQKDLSPYNRARGKACSHQSKISANDWKRQST